MLFSIKTQQYQTSKWSIFWNVCYLWSFNSFVPSRHDVLRMTKTKSEKARGIGTVFPLGVDLVKNRLKKKRILPGPWHNEL